MERTEYTVFCTSLTKRYSKSFDTRADATGFYDRSCSKWPYVYMTKHKFKLNSAGTTWYATEVQYIYYKDNNPPTIMKSAEYRNVARQ